MAEEKRIPDDKYRIIKIGKEALFELICEAFKEREEEFFDIADATTIVKSFSVDWEKGEFICVPEMNFLKKRNICSLMLIPMS